MPQRNPPQGQWQGQPPQPYTQYPQPPYPQPGKDMMPPLKPRKKLWRRNLVILSVIVLILVASAGVYARYKVTRSTNTAVATHATTHRSTTTPTHPTATSTPSTVTPTSTATPVTFNGTGTYTVGTDIQHGTYRTRNKSQGCNYTRIGKDGTVITQKTTDGPAIITIDKTDTQFVTQNCSTWTTDVSQITKSKTSFGDGMFIVNTDIQPGKYTNTGQSGCTYARLSGFHGTQDEIIETKTTDTAATVTIKPDDKGFQSNGCGTWTKNNNGT